MPHYHQSGSIPHKRHTQFRKPDGGLYSEQLFSTEGFSSDSSLLYHTHPPTQIIKTDKPYSVMPEIAEEKMLKKTLLLKIVVLNIILHPVYEIVCDVYEE